jgi:hypothetical protein
VSDFFYLRQICVLCGFKLASFVTVFPSEDRLEDPRPKKPSRLVRVAAPHQ